MFDDSKRVEHQLRSGRRRVIISVLLCSAGFTAPMTTACAGDSEHRTSSVQIPLVDDTDFRRGLIVWDPAAGKHVERGQLRPQTDLHEPIWGAAQWHSRFSLADAKPKQDPDGTVQFFDGAKRVRFFPKQDERGDLLLGLDAINEYEGKAPERGDPWPHLLVERRFLSHPIITELDGVHFKIRYRLTREKIARPEGFDSRRHTGQFVFYITVQNRNRQSVGYGDYLWFGILLYDTRHRFPPGHAAKDAGSEKKPGTGKFIYQPAFDRISKQTPHDREWVTVDVDLLPLIHEGLATAWTRGYLLASRYKLDYRLGGMNMGWEVTGPLDVAVAIDDFSLTVGMKQD